jgi:hypothetical protein
VTTKPVIRVARLAFTPRADPAAYAIAYAYNPRPDSDTADDQERARQAATRFTLDYEAQTVKIERVPQRLAFLMRPGARGTLHVWAAITDPDESAPQRWWSLLVPHVQVTGQSIAFAGGGANVDITADIIRRTIESVPYQELDEMHTGRIYSHLMDTTDTLPAATL